MNKKALILFYAISIFMLTNDALFTWLGHVTGLVFWRQLIWLVGIVIVFRTLGNKNLRIPEIRKICNGFNRLYVILIILSIFAFIIPQFNLIRIVHAFIGYTYGLPFLLFPYFSRYYGWSSKSFDSFFIFLGLFISLGFLFDFLTGGIITMMFYGSVTDLSGDFSDGRYSFLSTATTIITMIYCVCQVCCFKESQNAKRAVKKWLLLTLSVFFIFGSIFSGSRQTLAAMMIVEVAGVVTVIKSRKVGLFSIAIVALVLVIAFPYANKLFLSNEGATERYSAASIQGDERYKQWQDGLHDSFTSPLRLTIGEGLGYVHGMKARPGEKVGRHYESTVFTRISEIGLIPALFWLLMPVYYVYKYRKQTKNFLLYAGVMAAYLFISFISPNGGSELSQISLFVILGMELEDRERSYLG